MRQRHLQGSHQEILTQPIGDAPIALGHEAGGLQVQVHQKNENGSHRRVHTSGFWHRDRNSGDTQKEFAILVPSDSSVFCLWMGFPNNVRLGAAPGLSGAVMPRCGVVYA